MIGLNAQNYEVGLFAGGANYIGDIGATTYINPNKPVIGALFKWNKSIRYSWRASIIRAGIRGVDSASDSEARKERDYSFNNTITEFSAGLEVNFVKFNLHKMGPAFTPYLYTGVTYFTYGNRRFQGAGQVDMGKKGSFSIPMTIGVKKNISRFFVIGAEIGARYTFTDNLDGSNAEGYENISFGNVESNDWYVFSGITFTYMFGRKPCYDCSE